MGLCCHEILQNQNFHAVPLKYCTVHHIPTYPVEWSTQIKSAFVLCWANPDTTLHSLNMLTRRITDSIKASQKHERTIKPIQAFIDGTNTITWIHLKFIWCLLVHTPGCTDFLFMWFITLWTCCFHQKICFSCSSRVILHPSTHPPKLRILTQLSILTPRFVKLAFWFLLTRCQKTLKLKLPAKRHH